MAEPKIVIDDLTKKFGNTFAINNLSLKIFPSEIFVLLGPNGAGKTTTLKIISGLLKPDQGTVKICGLDISKQPIQAKQKIGLLPEQPYMYEKLTGLEFLKFICDIYKVKVDQKNLDELLGKLDLLSSSNELIERYSFGMKQKLLLASIILRKPEVMLLDEPFVGLDPKSMRYVRKFFSDYANRNGSILICTHILEIAEKVATRIGIINKGKMIYVGKKEELLSIKRDLEDVFLELTERM